MAKNPTKAGEHLLRYPTRLLVLSLRILSESNGFIKSSMAAICVTDVKNGDPSFGLLPIVTTCDLALTPYGPRIFQHLPQFLVPFATFLYGNLLAIAVCDACRSQTFLHEPTTAFQRNIRSRKSDLENDWPWNASCYNRVTRKEHVNLAFPLENAGVLSVSVQGDTFNF